MCRSAPDERHQALHPAGHSPIASNNIPLSAESTSEPTSESIPSHPLGVRPLGNLYLSSLSDARVSAGVFQSLPDELLMPLFEYLDQKSLRQLGYTCRFLHAFSHSGELWKPLFIESHSKQPRAVEWRGSWRRSLLGLTPEKEAKIPCQNVFSDALHRPFACAHINLSKCTQIPKANEIKRVESLSYDEFAANWSNKPFILTKCIQEWPAYGSWSIDLLQEKYPGVGFQAEAVHWPLLTYCKYMFDNDDESPLYLFDPRFVENMQIAVGREHNGEYWAPECFGPDLFEVLGNERPDHRWLIIGPKRSGSTFHKDPNATSAWNAVLQGAKYWIMFPPSVLVPGVYVSKDNSEVTSPLSIAEWLDKFLDEARRMPQCLEGVCKEGEILHVPSGWWHLVVNLESGIAITQNFVPRSYLSEVLGFLRDKADQVSGFKNDIIDPYRLFIGRLGEHDTKLVEKALEGLDSKLSKKRRWDMAIGTQDEPAQSNGGGFSFGFGEDNLDLGEEE